MAQQLENKHYWGIVPANFEPGADRTILHASAQFCIQNFLLHFSTNQATGNSKYFETHFFGNFSAVAPDCQISKNLIIMIWLDLFIKMDGNLLLSREQNCLNLYLRLCWQSLESGLNAFTISLYNITMEPVFSGV